MQLVESPARIAQEGGACNNYTPRMQYTCQDYRA